MFTHNHLLSKLVSPDQLQFPSLIFLQILFPNFMSTVCRKQAVCFFSCMVKFNPFSGCFHCNSQENFTLNSENGWGHMGLRNSHKYFKHNVCLWCNWNNPLIQWSLECFGCWNCTSGFSFEFVGLSHYSMVRSPPISKLIAILFLLSIKFLLCPYKNML